MLCSMPTQSARLAYLPDYFQTLLKAAALNSASFDTIGPDGKYEACAVLLPPGKRVDNTWTLIPAGFLGCLWRLGWGGCKVCYVFLVLLVSSKIHCLSLSPSASLLAFWHKVRVPTTSEVSAGKSRVHYYVLDSASSSSATRPSRT